MVYTLKNDTLEVKISDLGAEIQSVKRGNCEYIWQGNPEFWECRAPIMFPFCGRQFEGKYTVNGKTFEMTNHGFAKFSEFSAKQDGNRILFTLTANEKTKEIYPFDFIFEVAYELVGDKLSSTLTVKNPGKEVLPATVGAHPGFNIPLDRGEFEDWYAEFENPCSPDEILSTPAVFLTGRKRALPIIEGSKIIHLKHSYFDIDAVFMQSADRKVTLKSAKSERFVTVSFPDMPYVGFWHAKKSKAPYVCVEPWCGLPAYDGEIRELTTAPDFFRIFPAQEKTVGYSIIFG